MSMYIRQWSMNKPNGAYQPYKLICTYMCIAVCVGRYGLKQK